MIDATIINPHRRNHSSMTMADTPSQFAIAGPTIFSRLANGRPAALKLGRQDWIARQLEQLHVGQPL
jgi:hypothetical protein